MAIALQRWTPIQAAWALDFTSHALLQRRIAERSQRSLHANTARCSPRVCRAHRANSRHHWLRRRLEHVVHGASAAWVFSVHWRTDVSVLHLHSQPELVGNTRSISSLLCVTHRRGFRYRG